MINMLLRSVETGERLEMIYISNKGEISQRVIRLEKVIGESFRAYCYSRKQIRTFKISNILSIVPIKKQYRRGA
ncbi:hypothetical protein ACQKCU_25275 [Heyndrickxia sporothermodurans]